MDYQLGESAVLSKIFKNAFSKSKKGVSFFVALSMVLSLSTPFMLYPSVASASETIFSDGFESEPNNFVNWTAVDSDWNDISDDHSGVRGAEVDGTGTDELRKNISTSGYNNLTLSYWYKMPGGLSSADNLKVQWSIDGTTWNTIIDYTDSDTVANWVQATHNLPVGAENNSGFRFRFLAENLENSDKFRLDDVLLTGDSIPTTGTIVITKVANGGEATFPFTSTGGLETPFDIDTTQGPTKTFNNVTPGTYTITEESLAGWDFTSLECVDPTTNTTTDGTTATIDVAAGETVTCTYTNTKRGSLTIVKDVVNPNGDPVDDNTNFTVNVLINEGDENEQEQSGSVSESNDLVLDNSGEYFMPGTSFTVTEEQNSNYGTIDEFTYSDDCTIESLEAGQDAVCTITNKQKQGTLTVNKTVDNSHGFENPKYADDFAVDVMQGDTVVVDDEPFVSESETSLTGKAEILLNPGTYSVVEPNTLGYAPEYDDGDNQACQNIVITSGGTATCDVTNHDLLPGYGAVTVTKSLPNDNGGTAQISDFVLQLTPSFGEDQTPITVQSGIPTQHPAGTYVVGEVLAEGTPESYWTQYSPSTVCSVDGVEIDGTTITLTEGSVYQCIITNNDIAPVLTLQKVVENTYGGTQAASAWTLTATGATSFSGPGPAVTSDSSFDLGTYALSEEGPAGYTASEWVCEGNGMQEGSSVTLELGQSEICTITNSEILVDSDNDGVGDSTDNCPAVANPDQSDVDEDGIGDACDDVNNNDTDNDGVTNGDDNCPEVANSDQANNDSDSMGDVCDPDDDNDGLTDTDETSGDTDPFDGDSDDDTISDGPSDPDGEEGPITLGPDGADNCPVNANTDQADNDDDGIGNVCDETPDGTPSNGGGGGGSTSTGSSSLHTIIASATGNGLVTPAGSNIVTSGSNQAFSIIPGFGSQIVDVLVDGVSVGPVSSWTFTFVIANHTISATFTPAGQVAGAFTDDSPLPGTVLGQATSSISSDSSEQQGDTQTATEESSTGDELPEIAPLPTDEINQTAGLEGAPGWKTFLTWLGANWLWILFWLLLLLIAYYLYREWKKSQKKTS